MAHGAELSTEQWKSGAYFHFVDCAYWLYCEPYSSTDFDGYIVQENEIDESLSESFGKDLEVVGADSQYLHLRHELGTIVFCDRDAQLRGVHNARSKPDDGIGHTRIL
jgi:hypothetical protein